MSRLDVEQLIRLAARPRLFASTGRDFWNEPYIAGHILFAHLDPANDDASRTSGEIRRSVSWMDSVVRTRLDSAGSRYRILDLGCGPGLYAAQFARAGFDVHGIDFSPIAVEYASSYARRHGLCAHYECSDMRTLSIRDRFHAATMIYGGFCVLSNADRLSMLRRIRRALVSGGLFFFDVFTHDYVKRTAVSDRWYTSRRRGFWMEEPHLVLERSYEYPADQVGLNRYIVVGNEGELRDYNVWRHWYDRQSVARIVERGGFEIVGIYGDLCGSKTGGEWIGVVARKQ